MQKIIWHYLCRNTKPGVDKYLKYLMISLDSLINIGQVDPKNIYITLDIPDNFTSIYLDKILNYNTNIRQAPKYKNHFKINTLYSILIENPDIDKAVQIDVDTLITDPDIIRKISNLEGAVNHTTIGWSPAKTIETRDGCRHPTWGAEHIPGTARDHSRNLLFSLARENPSNAQRYQCFKHFMNIAFDFDLESALDSLKNEKRMLIGYAVIFAPKLIPQSYWKFVCTLDLFFADDEEILILGELYSGLKYSDVNIQDKIIHGASNTDDFKKLKGVIHFPPKDEEIKEYMDDIANIILNKK
jgi:hypothetical protein